jgi:hypothetical protein
MGREATSVTTGRCPRRGLATAAALLMLVGHVAHAASVPGVYSTGLDDLRVPLAAGAVDPHWELVESPDGQYPGPAAWVVNEGFPIPPWVANDGASKWIGPRADAGAGTAPGNYVYRLRFSLDDFDPPTTVLTGRWASDNSGVDVRLNGQSLGLANEGGFTQFTAPFEITRGFVDGTNVLEFVVNNAGDGANPSGFRAEVSATADPAPGPGTPPTLTAQPADLSTSPGEEARFTVSARGGRPLNYQWRFNGFPLTRATNALLTIPTVSESWVGEYSVRVSNEWGSVTSRVARLTLGYRSARTRRLEPAGPSSRRSGIAFSEIHYEPAPSADLRNREFVELYNSNPFVEDLSGWRLTGEWDITLPPGTLIPARSHLVIAADPQAIREIHGITNVVGGTTQRLNNAGGTLRLRKPSGGIVLELEYRPGDPWPVAAAGFGPSLVPARPSLGEANPAAWRASTRIGGSPGTNDPDPDSAFDGLVINEVVRNPVGAQQPFVELFNPAPFARELTGCTLRGGTNAPHPIAPGTTIRPGGWTRIEIPAWVWAESRMPVLLVDAEQARVIDAVEVPGQLPGTSAGRSPDGAPVWRSLAASTPGAANSAARIPEIVVNEVHYHPAGDRESEEFVELLNRGPETVDLGGWQLRRGIQFVFPQGTLLAPGQAIAVAADAALLRLRNPGVPADRILGNFTGNLSDGGEELELARPALQTLLLNGVPTTRPVNVPVERFTYRDGGRWSRWADGNGSSLERIDPRSDPDQPGSWQASDETSRAPWTLVEVTAVAGLSHPSVPSADQLQILLLGEGEALIDDIEVIAGGRSLLANGGFESGISGWVAQGTHRPSTLQTSGARTGTRALRIVATERGDHVANRIRRPLTQAIANGTSVTLRAWVRWLRGHPEILLRLRNGSVEVVGTLTQPQGSGTPGIPNTAFRANQGPTLSDVRHEPILPAANQAVRVIARIADPDRIGTAEVKYRLDPATTLLTVPMRDDGQNGDERAGDGEFVGLIPAQPAGTLVAFRIEARDAAGSPATTVFPALAPEQECLVRFGEPTGPGTLGTYRMWLTQSTISRWASREIMSNEGLDATLVFGTNRVVYNAAAKYSGSSYTAGIYDSPVGNLCGYDIAIPDDDLFLGGTRVLLDWPIRDNTYLREQLMYWFLERLGLPNMYRRHVHLYVNGQRRGAVYEDIQQPGSDTIRQFFAGDEDGSLWKTDCWNEFDDRGSRLDPCILNTLEVFNSGGTKKVARYRWNWRPRAVRGSANDFSDLFALIDAVNVPAANLPASAEALIDVDHWMRTFAMNDLASFWDAFGNPNGKNTFLYKPERGRWMLMSWDFDVGLGVFNDPPDAALFDCNDPVLNRMYQSPPLVRKYWTALEESLGGFFQTGVGSPIETFLAPRFAALQAAGTGPAATTAITAWINQRRAYLNGQIARHRAAFAIRSNNGNDFTTADPIVTLAGTAPVRVASLRLNNVDWPVQWTTTTNWTMRLGLRPGTNRLEVTGVDRAGTLVPAALDVIQVVATGTAPPLAQIRINEWLASNNNAVADPADGRFDDWFELYNIGDLPVDLAGYTVTDDLTRPARYTIPPGFVVQPGAALVVWADGQPEQTRAGQSLHVNFQLARSGSDIALFDNLGRRVDAIRYTAQTTDVAEGRWGDGADGPFLRLAQPTPGTTNALPAANALNIRVRATWDPAVADLELEWNVFDGRSYRIERQATLHGVWQPLEPDVAANGTNATVRLRIGENPEEPAGLYRVRLLP